MLLPRSRALILGMALVLSGCSFSSDALWPSLTGDEADAESLPRPAGQAASPAAQPALGTSTFVPDGVTPGEPTGTYVGEKVQQLRQELVGLQNSISTHNAELQQLRAATVQDSQRYHGTVAAINARLQVGTTPGNPILVQQFNSAQKDLEQLSNDIAAMNNLANDVGEDSTRSGYLLESVQATYGLSGAVDEDHEQLAVLQDEVNRTVVLIERLLKEVSEDVRRQTAYLANERSNLNAILAGIKAGELLGQSMVTTGPSAVVAETGGPAFTMPGSVGARRPLVRIAFSRPNVNYESPLNTAIKRVLESRPNAAFEVAAVAPAGGGPAQVSLNTSKAKRHAEQVARFMLDMGLPANRVTMTTGTSPQATANEVHVYLR